MFTSVTRRPVRFSTRLITLRRVASATRGIDSPSSTVMVRSTAASSSPTSTLTPLESFPPLVPPVTLPATLCRIPPTAAEAPPPICAFSTSCAATPAIWETTALLIVVLPISLWSGLPWLLPVFSLMLVLSVHSSDGWHLNSTQVPRTSPAEAGSIAYPRHCRRLSSCLPCLSRYQTPSPPAHGLRKETPHKKKAPQMRGLQEVAGAGFEPATFGLSARRATRLLHP